MDQMEMMMMMEMQKLPEYSISPPPHLFHSPNHMDSFSSGIEFQDPYNDKFEISRNNTMNPLERRNSMGAMREMIFRMAAMQPVQIDPETVKPPKRRNVKISKDPQSVAARHRRERISEKIRILQRIVPGGTKMDTASMLDEAIHYVKFLKKQVHCLERANVNIPVPGIGFPAMDGLNYASSLGKGCQSGQMLGSSMQMLM